MGVPLPSWLVSLLLRTFLVLFYVISHLYDYVTFPLFFLWNRAWRVRRYKRTIHARREDRNDAVLFHSLVQPGPINVVMQRNNLNTMDNIFKYLASEYDNNDCLGTREILAEESETQPNGKVFAKYVLGGYSWKSFSDVGREINAAAQGLRDLGLKSQDRIGILAETRAQWLIAAGAAFRNNLSIVTIYTTLGTDGVSHALNETEVATLICSHETLPKVNAVLPLCPHLKNLVLMESQSPAQDSAQALHECVEGAKGKIEKALLFSELMKEQGSSDKSPTPPKPMDCAIIMYTSGSTGKPKGVLLCHRNLVTAIGALCNIAKFRQTDRYIGYLPLAHVLELLAEVSCLMYGVKIGYSSANTLTNKSSKVRNGSKGDANYLRPTLMCSVPLILERIYKSVVDTMQRQGWAVEELFHYLVQYKKKWQDRGFDTPLLNKTLFRKIRYFLGGRVRLMLSGGAPLSPDTHSLTRTCICVPLMQGYGLTETTACATVTSIHDRSTGRAGAPLMNVTLKLVNWEEGNYLVTDQPYPRGEVHVGGDNVALGYFRNEEKTLEDFYDEEGRRWFRTGDIGEIHSDGVLKIIDRKKDLVKLQHGEYVSFGRVEAVLKTCAVVENLCLYALSSKDHVMAIVVPDKAQLEEMQKKDPEVDDIKSMVLKKLSEHGLKYGLQKFEIPAKIVLTNEEWTPDTGLVTAAFKIRRRQIVQFYQKKIDEVYSP